METTMIQTNGYGDVIAWLRGGDVTPDSHMENRFVEMLSTLVAECIVANRKEIQRLCTAADRKERRENRTPSGLSLRALMQETSGTSVPVQIPASARMDEDDDLPPAELPQPEKASYDSLTFAKALVHMAELEDRALNMSQIQAILYIAYGVWLAQKDDRLFDEHPQAWQYGPVFPRVYTKLKKGMTDSQEQYLKLMNDSPERFAFLERCFRRYAWTRASDLAAPHISKGTPWSQTRQAKPDSPVHRIDDSLVGQWFRDRVSPAG